MGRQLAILLATEDEQELLDLAHSRDFILVSTWLRRSGLIAEEIARIPDDEACPEREFSCVLVQRNLARLKRARLANRELDFPYVIGPTDLPCIEWIRTSGRRISNFQYDPLLKNRLYIATSWDYGADERWLPPVEALYDELVKRVKKLTVKIQDVWPRYVSRRFGPAFFDVAGLSRSGEGWVHGADKPN